MRRFSFSAVIAGIRESSIFVRNATAVTRVSLNIEIALAITIRLREIKMTYLHGYKRIFVSSTISLLIIGGGVAYAYFTTTGSGPGSTAVGTSSPLTITQIVEGSTTGDASYSPVALLPGGDAQSLAISIHNPSKGDQGIHSVTVSLAAPTLSAISAYNTAHPTPQVQATASDVTSGGIPIPGCLASWFNTANWGPVATDVIIAGNGYAVIGNNANGTVQASSTLSISLMSAGVIQDACKLADVDLTFTSN